MISEKVEQHHKRKGASCLRCEALASCFLRYNILHPARNFSNYAAEGCTKYKGDIKPKNPLLGSFRKSKKKDINQAIREFLLAGNSFSLAMCREWGITSARLHNNMTVLRKRGYMINRERINNSITYSIYGCTAEAQLDGCSEKSRDGVREGDNKGSSLFQQRRGSKVAFGFPNQL